MRSVSPLALMVCACVLVACSSGEEPLRTWTAEDHVQPQADDSREPVPEAPAEQGGVSRAALALFNVSCASCHGREGRGDGPGRPPGAQMPDFSSVELQKGRTDEALAQVIMQGRNLMPPFGKQVNPQGIAALVAHIRSFAKAP